MSNQNYMQSLLGGQQQPQQPAPQAPPQQAPPQQYQQAPVQAQPQYQQQAPGMAPAPTPGGIFSRYSQAAKGLGNRVGNNYGPKIYFDSEGTYILEVERLVTGISQNKKKNAGRPFIAGNFKVLATFGLLPESRIQPGMTISYQKYLPINPDPQFMSVGDELNLAEALGLVSSILKLKHADPEGNFYVDLAMADQMCMDDGAPIKGRVVGCDVTASPSAKPDGTPITYYNGAFFAVDPQGNRIDGYTPEEIMHFNQTGQQF